MFAIIKTGGKQYKVEKGTVLNVEKLGLDEGAKVTFDEVLLVSDGDAVQVGKPTVSNAQVTGTIVKNGREKKKIVFKYKNKTRYSVKQGHRQHFSQVEITDIKA